MSGLCWVGELGDKFLWRLTQCEVAQLRLFSEGGDCDVMAAALDLMEGSEWITHAFGRCMSAAVPIIAAGAKGERTSLKSTRWMVHLPSLFTFGDKSSDELGEEKLELERYEKLYCDALGRFSKKRVSWWLKQIKTGKNHYFGSEEAVKLGLIDRIVS